MEIFRTFKTGHDEAVKRSFDALMGGCIIAFPTETFYGLGVKYDHPAALERLSELKKRPRDKAMPLIIGHRRLLPIIAAAVSPAAERLMDLFWPGPLTLILPAKDTLSFHITAGTGAVAVRVPGRSFALSLARTLDFPITATSANVSSQPPANSAEAVSDYFGDSIDIIIDCGKTPGTLPSTIVDATGERPVIVRRGMLPEKEIIRALQAC
jgi:L-threonylcarbamoyladenylate synthase